MKKILLIDDSDTYTWCLQKYLQHRGYPVKTACTLKEARAAIQEEMPLVVCCDLDLPDGSGMDFLDEVRAADKELPFILASCQAYKPFLPGSPGAVSIFAGTMYRCRCRRSAVSFSCVLTPNIDLPQA